MRKLTDLHRGLGADDRGLRPRDSDRSDHGAVAVLTAILTSSALIAFAVLAVDTGDLFDEHRQLRSGADAAAVAVAQLCAQKTSCATDGLALARLLANGNDTSDARTGGASTVDRVCGTVRDLPACPPRPANNPVLSTCPPVASTSAKYVEVRTRTGTPDGRNIVDPVFAPSGTSVGSCARAGYGAPTSLVSNIPIIVSQCVIDQYKAQTAHGADFAPRPPYTTNRATWETAITLHQGGKGDDCAGPAGQKAPGNFGYIEDGSAECPVTTQVDSTVGGDTGNSLTKQCDTSYMTALIGTIVFLPVFDPGGVSGSGSNVDYRVKGYVPFYVTGWKFPSKSAEDGVTPAIKCASNTTCVYGMYVRGNAPPPTPYDPAVDPRALGTAVTKLLA